MMFNFIHNNWVIRYKKTFNNFFHWTNIKFIKQFYGHHIWMHQHLFQNNQCKTHKTLYYIPGQSILPSIRRQTHHHSNIDDNSYKKICFLFLLCFCFFLPFFFARFSDFPSFLFSVFMARNFLRFSFSIHFCSFSLSLSSNFFLRGSLR